MELPKEVENLLLPVPKPSNWVPDEYDVGVRDIMGATKVRLEKERNG